MQTPQSDGFIPIASYQPGYDAKQAFINGNPLLNDLTPQKFRELYFWGLPLTGTVMGDQIPVEVMQQKINIAVDKMEEAIGTFIIPRRIRSVPQGNPAGLVAGQDFDLMEVPYDYDAKHFQDWAYIQLRHYPVLTIESMVLVWPSNIGILNVPNSWIQLNPLKGVVRLVPSQTEMGMFFSGALAAWLPFISAGMFDHLPQFVQMNYTAGVYPIAEAMKDAIYKRAAIEVLQMYADAYYPGIQSASNSVDGFNQSFSLRSGNPFADRIKAYEKDVSDYTLQWKSHRRGIRARVLG